MTTSAIPAAVDWLVGQCQTGIVPVGISTTPVYIQDGPLVTLDPTVYPQRVAVGWDGLNPNEPGVVGEQEFATIGARQRDERFEIVMTVEDWSGDTAAKVHRDNAFALMAQIELMIRGVRPAGPGDITMGGSVKYSQIAGPIQFHIDQNPNGAAATCVFRIQARARLTT